MLAAMVAFMLVTAQAGNSPAEDWAAWRARRSASLGSSNGWTTLVGLHWLREGRNFAGSDPTNNVVFPAGRAPASVGIFVRAGRSVQFEATPRHRSDAGGQGP